VLPVRLAAAVAVAAQEQVGCLLAAVGVMRQIRLLRVECLAGEAEALVVALEEKAASAA
jgi:hypothetical protein